MLYTQSHCRSLANQVSKISISSSPAYFSGGDTQMFLTHPDVLLDHDGNAQTIVISVGGFLGIGSKDVAVPFKTMKWQTEAREVATAPPAATGTGTAPATVKTDPAATEANQGYPDVAMLDMTKAQLQNAPDFQYAPDPTAHSANPATTHTN